MLSPATQADRAGPRHRPHRSTKAGMLSPATPCGSATRAATAPPLNEGRDVKPGDTYRSRAARQRGCALNEGRDVKPGDTVHAANQPVHHHDRSTKAGMLSPATRGRGRMASTFAVALNEGRDVKPGDTGLERVDGHGVAPRSTKAGMLSPATPASALARANSTCSAQRRPGC